MKYSEMKKLVSLIDERRYVINKIDTINKAIQGNSKNRTIEISILINGHNLDLYPAKEKFAISSNNDVALTEDLLVVMVEKYKRRVYVITKDIQEIQEKHHISIEDDSDEIHIDIEFNSDEIKEEYNYEKNE